MVLALLLFLRENLVPCSWSCAMADFSAWTPTIIFTLCLLQRVIVKRVGKRRGGKGRSDMCEQCDLYRIHNSKTTYLGCSFGAFCSLLEASSGVFFLQNSRNGSPWEFAWQTKVQSSFIVPMNTSMTCGVSAVMR